MAEGICKLTGETGPLVKAHILPKALTSPAVKGQSFAQAGSNYAPRRRRDSWYDPDLVTRAGEDILARYDSWAIEELRRHRLVWSGWGGDQALADDEMLLVPGLNGIGFRSIDTIDQRRLRLFLLSILWRAAVSKMHEFSEIRMLPNERRRLTRMVLDGRAEPFSFFPVMLFQLSSRGEVHNLSPIAQHKRRDPTNPDKGTIPIFRFHFDGLIVHFHRKDRARDVEAMGPMMVGRGKPLLVGLRPYDGSWQEGNLEELKAEAEERWPGKLARIYRS